jgi:hypothetical protein
MRRTFAGLAVAALLTTFVPGRAEAQTPLIFVAGPSLMTISSDIYDASSTVGVFAAAGTRFQLNETVSVSPFLGYVQKGASFDGQDYSSASYDYIEIPVLFGVGVPVGERNLRLSAGPQIAFQIKCDEDGFDCTEYTDHESTQFGFVGTAALSLNEMLSVGLGADFGATNLFEVDYKTRNYFLFLSYATAIGG